jgi:hypothetical protein
MIVEIRAERSDASDTRYFGAELFEKPPERRRCLHFSDATTPAADPTASGRQIVRRYAYPESTGGGVISYNYDSEPLLAAD